MGKLFIGINSKILMRLDWYGDDTQFTLISLLHIIYDISRVFVHCLVSLNINLLTFLQKKLPQLIKSIL